MKEASNVLKQFIRKRRDDAFVLKLKHVDALASNGVKQPLSEILMFLCLLAAKGVNTRNWASDVA